MRQIAVVVGSLRRESINLRLARALAKLGEPQLVLEVVDLHDLPLYNEDLWDDPPPAVARLKQAVEAAEGVLFVTPEYNRGIPAVTKNAIDWGTRPRDRNCWTDKPAAAIGTSPGPIGTAVAQAQVRDLLTVCGMRVMGQPEVYLAHKPGLIADDFSITDTKTQEFLAGFLARFEMWLSRG